MGSTEWVGWDSHERPMAVRAQITRWARIPSRRRWPLPPCPRSAGLKPWSCCLWRGSERS